MKRHLLLLFQGSRKPKPLQSLRRVSRSRKESLLTIICPTFLVGLLAMASLASALPTAVRSASPSATELTLQCADGVELAGQLWKAATNTSAVTSSASGRDRILCLHGWMDNCRSFHYLAPSIIQAQPNVEIVTLDLPGHGRSSHKSIDGPPALLAEAAYYVAEAVKQLGWIPGAQSTEADSTSPSTFTLIGHSMGAGIGCLYSAAFPEQVERLVLLEGVGPLARNPHDVAKHVRSHVQRRLLANADPRDPRVYPSLEKAVQTRCFTAKNFPGSQWLSTEAATEMVLRGSTPVGDQGELKFRHDPRLQWPSLQYFTPDQTESLYDDIQCPTALLLAQDGWPFDEHRFKDTIEKLQPSVYRRLPGSHHFHADPDSAERAAEEVITFLSM